MSLPCIASDSTQPNRLGKYVADPECRRLTQPALRPRRATASEAATPTLKLPGGKFTVVDFAHAHRFLLFTGKTWMKYLLHVSSLGTTVPSECRTWGSESGRVPVAQDCIPRQPSSKVCDRNVGLPKPVEVAVQLRGDRDLVRGRVEDPEVVWP